MIHTINCDLLSIEDGIIIHGCNSRGVMGSGVAKQIREKYPKAYEAYKDQERRSGLFLGDIVPVVINERLLVVNAITQKDYGRDPDVRYVNYGAIATCFARLEYFTENSPLCPYQFADKPVYFPMIGAGLANGDWSVISEIIDLVYLGEKFLCLLK